MLWSGRLTGLALAAALASGAAKATETIAFLRHGEKPAAGLGQLDCQGLNRALKLPQALAALFPVSTFGKPVALFAPNPSVREKDHEVKYDYVRALATIEPTAVALGMPVNTQHGFDEVDGLTQDLEAADYREGLVIVAWEHRMADEAVRKLLKDYDGDPVLRIDRHAERDRRRLDRG
jgi:broad specificity phosphatase PhoE